MAELVSGMRCTNELRDFDHGHAAFKSGDYVGKQCPEGVYQRHPSNVAEPYPDHLRRCAVSCSKVLEVFIHGNDAVALNLGVSPDFTIGSVPQPKPSNMAGFNALLSQKSG